VIAAMRWALYAERLAPMLDDDDEILARPLAGLAPDAAGRLAMAKFKAGDHRKAIHAALYPEA